MRRKLLLFTGILILIPLFMAHNSSTTPVYADSFLQETPRLDGFQIYFTEANGEASRFDRSGEGLSRFAGLLRELGANLNTVEWRSGFPTDADLVIIAGPLSDFAPDQTARLWTYVNNGGKLLLLADPPSVVGGRVQGFRSQSGLFQLMWYDMGVRVRDDVILTAPEVASTVAATATLTSVSTTATPAPAATEAAPSTASPEAQPPIQNFITSEFDSQHPVTTGFREDLAFFAARSLELDLSVREFPVIPLVFSAGDVYGETSVDEFSENQTAIYNIGGDTAPGVLPLAAAFENPTSGTRIVLIGDRDFATNGAGLRSSPANTGSFNYPGNIHFLLNAVSWLLGTDRIEISFPTPGPTATATLTPTAISYVADLDIVMSVSNIGPAVNEIIIYDVTVTNNGPDLATDVVVADTLPDGLNFILSRADTDNGYNVDTGLWNLGDLESGENAHLLFVVQVGRGTLGSTLTNTATVSFSSSTDPDPSNNTGSANIEVLAFIRQGD
jgi:uncharacterized repeat protein (TIGR01451 family)